MLKKDIAIRFSAPRENASTKFIEAVLLNGVQASTVSKLQFLTESLEYGLSADLRELIVYLCIAHGKDRLAVADIMADLQRYEKIVAKIHELVPEYSRSQPKSQEDFLDCGFKVARAIQDVFGKADLFDHDLHISYNMSEVLRAFEKGLPIGVCLPISILTRLVLQSFGVESEVVVEDYFVNGRYDMHARNAVVIPNTESEGGDQVYLIDRSRTSFLGDIVKGSAVARGVIGAAWGSTEITAYMLFEATRQDLQLSAEQKLHKFEGLQPYFPTQNMIFWQNLERQYFIMAVLFPVGSSERVTYLSRSAEILKDLFDVLYAAHGALLHKEDVFGLLNSTTDKKSDTFYVHLGAVLSDMAANGLETDVAALLQHPLFQPRD